MSDREKNFFERHKVKVLVLVNVAAIVAIDLVAGALLIPREQLNITIPHPLFHHGFRPSCATTFGYGPIFYEMYTNSLGLRDSSPRDIPLESDRKRILFMGDSFTEGVGVNFEESFVGRVTARFYADGVEVLNGGVKSYCPKLYLIKTRHLMEAVGLKFDHLIVMIDVSDIPDELRYEDYEPGLPPLKDRYLGRLQRSLRNRSYFFCSLDKWKRARTKAGLAPTSGAPAHLRSKEFEEACLGHWTYKQALFDQFGKKGLALAKANMEELLDLCAANGITVTIGVYPNAHQVVNRDLDSIMVKFWSAFAKENEIAFVNLFPLFIEDKEDLMRVYADYYIPEDVHWNAEGHRLAADALLEHLASGE